MGGSVRSHCLGVGKVSFLACLVLLEPCLGFVYRDVFCLTKYEKKKMGKKKHFHINVLSLLYVQLNCSVTKYVKEK